MQTSLVLVYHKKYNVPHVHARSTYQSIESVQCPWHALSIVHIGRHQELYIIFGSAPSRRERCLRSHSKQNKLHKYKRNEMMKNEKAPNLRNYEKVARTATNVIGIQFHDGKKVKSKSEIERKSKGYSFVFGLFMYVCVFQSLECVVR